MQVDYQKLFERAPARTLVLSPTLQIVAVSNGYLRAMNLEHEQLIGRGLFEAFPDEPGATSTSAVVTLRASLAHVLSTRTAHATTLQGHDAGPRVSEPGAVAARLWRAVNSPVLDDAGAVAWIVHTLEHFTGDAQATTQSDFDAAVSADLKSLSEERFRDLLDAAPDAMVVVGADGRIELANEQTEKLFGHARADLIGQTLDCLVPERFRGGHAAHVARFLAHPSSRPMGSGLELFGCHRDGSEFAIEVSLSPSRRASATTVTASIRDIRERKRLDTEVRRTAERLASAVENVDDAIALFDADDRLLLCNSAYRRLFAARCPGALVGRSHAELYDAWKFDLSFASDEERERYDSAHERSHREASVTLELRTNDARHFRATLRRTPEGGHVETIWDLTDEMRRQHELREARSMADAANSAKSEFLSSMSHELRTPLNAVLGFAQLLQRDRREPLSSRHLERVSQILKGGEHLLRLINDVLDLSRIEMGNVAISTERVEVAPVLDEVRATLEPAASRAEIALNVDVSAAPGAAISADRTRFAQILINFGSNAIKYNRARGRVFVRVSRPRAGVIRVSVEDSGIGIAPDKLEKIFQPFQRAGQETGPIEGTGIGLTITRRLAEIMHGTTGFESRHGEGSTFWVDLPEFEAADATSAVVATRHSSRPPGQRPSGLVLCVEDNPSNVSFLRDLIGSISDVTLITATTAEAGIEMARAQRPSVILMDINLPGMSGLDALGVLRQFPETREIPVIALTAAATERDRERGERAGFHRYLTKPIEVAELEAALEALLARPTEHR